MSAAPTAKKAAKGIMTLEIAINTTTKALTTVAVINATTETGTKSPPA